MSLEGTICPKCGKEFFPYPEHVYKAGSKRYCSWTCFNHRSERKAKKYKAVEQYTLEGVFVRYFDSVNQAAETMGCCPKTIRDVCTGKTKSALKSIWKYKERCIE